MNHRSLSVMVNEYAVKTYGDVPPQDISRRISRELEIIEASGHEFDFLRAYEITGLLRTANELWWLQRAGGGVSLIAFLLGITQVNPLPPHYYCPKCKRVVFNHQSEDGFDLPKHLCEQCGTVMRGDGHSISMDAFEESILRRGNLALFRQFNISTHGIPIVGEYLSHHGSVTPQFWDDDGEGGGAEVWGWLLAAPETLSSEDYEWRDVEYPKNSGLSVRAVRLKRVKDKLGKPLLYTGIDVFESQDLELLVQLCRKTHVLLEDIPLNEPPCDFSNRVLAYCKTLWKPELPGAKAESINIIMQSKRIEWFAKHYSLEYADLNHS